MVVWMHLDVSNSQSLNFRNVANLHWENTAYLTLNWRPWGKISGDLKGEFRANPRKLLIKFEGWRQKHKTSQWYCAVTAASDSLTDVQSYPGCFYRCETVFTRILRSITQKICHLKTNGHLWALFCRCDATIFCWLGIRAFFIYKYKCIYTRNNIYFLYIYIKSRRIRCVDTKNKSIYNIFCILLVLLW